MLLAKFLHARYLTNEMWNKSEIILGCAEKKFERPPVHLLHSIKSIICYEEEGPVCYEEEGPQIYITIEFSLSIANLRNRPTLYGSQYLYLLYPLMILSGNTDTF